MKKIKFILFWLLSLIPCFAIAQVSIESEGGWFESAYVTFSLTQSASYYNVYCKKVGQEYTILDTHLVRDYGTYGRADAMGLSQGEYLFKVVPVDENGVELENLSIESSVLEVKSHDRSGFAFFNGAEPGAYTLEGTLKSNAVIVYITNKNKDSVTLDVQTGSSTITECVGLQAILDGFKKGYDTRPLDVRIIGQITDFLDFTSSSNNYDGDIVVDLNKKTVCPGITIEGVGNDAVADGWGIRIKNCSNIEISNIGFMNCDSEEGDNIGLQQENEYIWVHNCDHFYGEAGGDVDQAKGDGALDCKKTNYVTISYNHFWDSGKCNLLGLKGETDDMYVTYHHNWYDHSDSRHPRVRYYSCHVYNNYYDGCSKYGVGATCGSSIFVENNYYRNTNKPMLISMQGTDIASGKGTFSSEDGGMIKAYGNEFQEKSSNFKFVSYQENSVEFDAYVASSKQEQVPSTVLTKQGSTSYNNFDTNASLMYTYQADEAESVPEIVKGDLGAGRLEHGDFQWTFNNSTDDSDYDVNTALKSALTNYKTSLVGLFVDTDEDTAGGGDGDGDGDGDDGGNSGNQGTTTPNEGYECNFTGLTPSNSFYTFTNCNYSDSKGSATVNGVTYTVCLKIESSTKISFTIEEEMVLTLVFEENETSPSIKIDDVTVSSSGSNIITYTLQAGTHTITKKNVLNLFYINLTSTTSSILFEAFKEDETTIYDLSGYPVATPIKGKIYIRKGKKFLYK